MSAKPGLLESKIGKIKKDTWVVIDEIQKIPQLLDEVHRLMEKSSCQFVLTGSSARKLKMSGVNLLGGRAITRNLSCFSAVELGEKFNLDRALQWGLLPLVALNPTEASDLLQSYVYTYLQEEIKAEGLVRKAEPFVRFLQVAGMLNGKQINSSNIARDAHIPRSTVDVYFAILEDTLLGYRLNSYRPNIKVREQTHPKFYWFDTGVARGAAGLLNDPVDSLWLGYALETYIFHELRVYNQVNQIHRQISYYRVHDNDEIDFVIEIQKAMNGRKAKVILIEVKYAKKWDAKWGKKMLDFKLSNKVEVLGMYGIYRGTERLNFVGVDIIPVNTFVELLYQGEIF